VLEVKRVQPIILGRRRGGALPKAFGWKGSRTAERVARLQGHPFYCSVLWHGNHALVMRHICPPQLTATQHRDPNALNRLEIRFLFDDT